MNSAALPHVYCWLKTHHPKIAKKLAKAAAWQPSLSKAEIEGNAAQLDALISAAHEADEITSESSSSSSDSSSPSEEDESSVANAAKGNSSAASIQPTLKRKAQSTSSEDSSEEEPAQASTKKVIKSVIAVVEDAPMESTLPPAKKAKIVAVNDESGTATITNTTNGTSESPALKVHPDRQKQHAKKQNVPFRRVRAEDVVVDQRLQDNSYDARGGNLNDYGAKASRDLIVTRGDKFRKVG